MDGAGEDGRWLRAWRQSIPAGGQRGQSSRAPPNSDAGHGAGGSPRRDRVPPTARGKIQPLGTWIRPAASRQAHRQVARELGLGKGGRSRRWEEKVAGPARAAATTCGRRRRRPGRRRGGGGRRAALASPPSRPKGALGGRGYVERDCFFQH
jgi:hypothetical protein